MRGMQEKILSAIETNIIKESQAPGTRGQKTGLEAVYQGSYAHTGNVYAQEGFDTAFVLRYSFNDDYCSLTVSGELVERELDPQNNEIRMTKFPSGASHRTVDIEVYSWEAGFQTVRYRVDDREPTIRWFKIDYDEGAKIKEVLALINYLARRGL